VMWRTADGGNTWARALVDASFVSVGVLGSSTIIAIAISAASFGVRSLDGGLTTMPMTYTGTPSAPIEGVRPLGDRTGVSQLQLDAQPMTAYMHLAPDLWRTQDDGATWALATSPDPVTALGPQVADVLADPKTPRRLVALRKSATSTTGGSELAVSTDAGTTWTPQALPVGQLVQGSRLWTVDADGNVWLILNDANQPKLYKLAPGATTWTVGMAPPSFGGSLEAIGNRLVLGTLLSDAGAAWRPGSPLTDPYLIDLSAFALRAAPTRVVFQYAGLRSGPLP
jgi:hypothetical protein